MSVDPFVECRQSKILYVKSKKQYEGDFTCLTSTTVTNKDELEGWCSRSSHGDDSVTFENGKKSSGEKKSRCIYIMESRQKICDS